MAISEVPKLNFGVSFAFSGAFPAEYNAFFKTYAEAEAAAKMAEAPGSTNTLYYYTQILHVTEGDERGLYEIQADGTLKKVGSDEGTANIEIQAADGYLQFRVNGGDWTNIISLDELKGPKGDPADLSPATETTLGGILASDTVLVDADGRATAVIPEADFASEEEVSAAIDEIFGKSGEAVTPAYPDGDNTEYGT